MQLSPAQYAYWALLLQQTIVNAASNVEHSSNAEQDVVYQNATFDIANHTNITYAYGLTCTDQFDNSTCQPMALMLDVYVVFVVTTADLHHSSTGV